MNEIRWQRISETYKAGDRPAHKPETQPETSKKDLTEAEIITTNQDSRDIVEISEEAQRLYEESQQSKPESLDSES